MRKDLAPGLVDAAVSDSVDDLCDRFEAAWKAVRSPSLEEFLGEASGEDRVVLRAELEKIDRAYRSRLDASPATGPAVSQAPPAAHGDAAAQGDARPADGAQCTPVSASTLPVASVAAVAAPAAVPWPTLPDYEIMAELGCGGMGVVYQARQRSLPRLVALKLPSANYLGARQWQRFRAEAETVARLRHPNIVQIHEVGVHDGRPYLALEFVEGGSLAQKLAGTPQPPRAAAAFVQTLARTVQYAHDRGIIHRDLKPGNVLLVSGGVVKGESVTDRAATHQSPLTHHQPKIADFGLAKWLQSDASPDGTAAVDFRTQTGELVGTPSYMAPEQTEGRPGLIGPAVDTYALGAILYELLIGGPPFKGATMLDTLEQVRNQEPVSPRRLQPRIPRDLETICLKCLNKDPRRRYARALELAEDLGRFLEGRPIMARPVGPLAMAWRWCGRHPAVAALTTAVVLLLLGVTAAATWAAVAANRAASEAGAKERIERREKLLHQIQLVQLSQHAVGWSERVWRLVAQAAELGDDDGRVRDEAAASLAGMDARSLKSFKDLDATAVAFDAEEKRLLMSGSDDLRTGQPAGGARLWDRDTDTMHISQLPGAGPVAFRADGTPGGAPVHLVARDGPSLVLWDVAKQRQISACGFLPEQKVPPSWKMTVMALSADGALIAASAREPDGAGLCAVWDADSGKQRFAFAARAHALAFSPKNVLLAVGGDNGEIEVWSVAQGKRLATLRSERMTILSVAFSADSGLQAAAAGKETMSGRLAAGERGGTLTIWDLASGQPRVTCRGGSSDNPGTVTFSPDGLTLASQERVFDAASGRLLLRFVAEYARGLAFSGSGTKLAVAKVSMFGAVGGVDIWELESERGIRTLRGLVAPVAKTRFSPDGRHLAALAHDWQIGVWDVSTGRLLRLLQAPEGRYHDNADLAFSPDGRQIAASVLNEARLWDIATGKQLRSWKLPLGLGDLLAFHAPDKLLLFRVETKSMKAGPWSPLPRGDGAEYTKDPRVCRIRDLLAPGPDGPKVLAVIEDFNKYVYPAVTTPDGSLFILEGKEERGAGERRFFKAIDFTGKELWTMRSNNPHHAGALRIDPTGKLAMLAGVPEGGASLVEVASCKLVETGDDLGFLGPEARLLARATAFVHAVGRTQGHALYRRGDKSPLLHLDIRQALSGALLFSPDGRFIALGNLDGSVSVYELPEIQRRLAALGLGW